jgi:hypothetical protein
MRHKRANLSVSGKKILPSLEGNRDARKLPCPAINDERKMGLFCQSTVPISLLWTTERESSGGGAGPGG